MHDEKERQQTPDPQPSVTAEPPVADVGNVANEPPMVGEPQAKSTEEMKEDPKQVLEENVDQGMVDSMSASDTLSDAIGKFIDHHLESKKAEMEKPEQVKAGEPGSSPEKPVSMSSPDVTKIMDQIESIKEAIAKKKADEPTRGVTSVTIQAHKKWQEKLYELEQELHLLQIQLKDAGSTKLAKENSDKLDESLISKARSLYNSAATELEYRSEAIRDLEPSLSQSNQELKECIREAESIIKFINSLKYLY